MIILNALFFTYAAIVFLAVVLGLFAPPAERVAACVCAASLVLSWMVFLASNTEYSVEQFVTGDHDLATHASMWMVMDTFCAGVAFTMARHTWWGPVLFGFLFLSCGNDGLLWLGLTKWNSYSNIADVLFLVEEAIFFAIGGSGLGLYLSRRFRLYDVRMVRAED